MTPQVWWLILGVVLAILEIVAPGFYLAWVGLAAILTAGATAVFGFQFVAQGIVFAALAVATVFVARHYFQRAPIVSDDPLLNDRSARLVGAVVTAVEPVDASQGRVKVGDSVWSAKGASAAVGDRLRVTRVDGGILVVEAV
jgi:inner membrane protein